MLISEQEIFEAKIMIVDDQEINVKLLRGILYKAGYRQIEIITDSRKAILTCREYVPDLLILDLNMPYVNGFQVMAEVRNDKSDYYLPILILSNEEDKEKRYKALEFGANDFINKPFDTIEVLQRIRNLIEVRILHNQQRNQNIILEKKVEERTKELYQTQLDAIQRLARAIEYRDSETGMHIIRMSKYSACLAKEIGLSADKCEIIETASQLHDVGKIAIPDSILRKPGKLTPEEWAIMKTHTTIGGELLSGSSSKFLLMAKEIALTHHEKWNGTGYPKGLVAEEIPATGRICCISDVFDALTTQRPYKRAWTVDETKQELKNQKEISFDPAVVDCFLDNFKKIEAIRQNYLDPDVNLEEAGH